MQNPTSNVNGMLIAPGRSFSSRVLATLGFCFVTAATAAAVEPIDIGDRRELFVDDFLIQRLSGGAEQVLEIPEPKEVVFTADAPWEGNTSAYFCLLADGDGFRAWTPRGDRSKGSAWPTASR